MKVIPIYDAYDVCDTPHGVSNLKLSFVMAF